MKGNGLTTRKFLATVGVIILAYIALLIGKLTGDQFVTLALFALGIFGAANVTAKHKSFNEGG